MAYAADVPILTIVERGIQRQGMLSNRLEWVAIEAEAKTSVLLTAEFQQIFREWLVLVEHRRSAPPAIAAFDPTEMKIGVLISHMTLKQVMGLVSTFLGFAATMFAAGYAICSYFPKHL